MSQTFTTFSYINTDTLALISSLWHNVSDSEGRPTYMVSGFVPVYDHRLDSQGEAPACEKFGTYNEGNATYTTFPEANVYESPFGPLSNKAGGILFNEDIYLWKPKLQAGYASNVYSLVKNSISGISSGSDTQFMIGTGYSELIDQGTSTLPIGTIKYFNNIPASPTLGRLGKEGTIWNDYVTQIKPNTNNLTIENTPIGNYFGVNTIGNKICLPWAGARVFQLTITNKSITNSVEYDTVSNSSVWDIGASNSNIEMSRLKATSSQNAYWNELVGNTFKINTSLAVRNNVQVTIGTGSGSSTNSVNRVVDVSTLDGTGFSLFQGIKNFSKGYTNEEGVEQTISSYRVRLDDQIGTIRFNKIITYIRLYQKDLNGKWGWSDTYYPFTVTILPEPVVKSDYGLPGIDSFELDIQIDYNQMVQSANAGNYKTILFDTEITNNYDGWAVLRNPLVSQIEDSSITNTDPTTTGLFGTQFDTRLFVTTDIDVTEYDNAGNQRGDLFREKYGRINSENKTYVYYDLDLSKISFECKDPEAITTYRTVKADYLIAFEDDANLNPVYHNVGIYDGTEGDVINPYGTKAVIYAEIIHNSELQEAVENKNEAIYIVQEQATGYIEIINNSESTQQEIDAAKVALAAWQLIWLTTSTESDISNQLSICNIVDYSNNGQYLEMTPNGVYSTYFKWHFDMTGPQNALKEFPDVVDQNVTNIVHPKIDIDVKWFSNTNALENDIPKRLIPVSTDANYWQLDTYVDGLGNTSRDYSPSMQPYRKDGSDSLVKMGLGRMSNPWEHIIGNRVYGQQTYGTALNGKQISLVRFDEQDRLYNNFNEQYLYNNVIIKNDNYESIGASPYDGTSDADFNNPTFKATINTGDEQTPGNSDIINDVNLWGMIVDRSNKDGQKFSMYQVKDTNLTLNDTTMSPYYSIESRLITGLVDYALYNRFNGYTYANRVYSLTTPATELEDIKSQHSQRLYKTLYAGDLGLRGQYFSTTDENQAGITAIALNTAFASYNDTTPLSTITSISFDSNNETNQRRSMTLLGSGMVLNYDKTYPNYNYDEMLKNTTTSLNTIDAVDDNYLAQLNTVCNLPIGLSVGNHGLDLIIYNGVGGASPYAESLVKVLITNTSSDAALKNSNYSALLTVDIPENKIAFNALTQHFDEQFFIGRQGFDADAANISKGLVITNQLLSLILKYPGTYSIGGTINTKRLGSYYKFNEVEPTTYQEQWSIFSDYIFNYGNVYQNNSILMNNKYNMSYLKSYYYNENQDTNEYSNNGGLPTNLNQNNQYVYFNLQKLNDQSLTFDLNFKRDSVNDDTKNNYFNSDLGVQKTQLPGQFGFDKGGNYFLKLYDFDKSERTSGTTLTDTNFDLIFRATSKMTVISSDITPRTPYINSYDVTTIVKSSDIPMLSDQYYEDTTVIMVDEGAITPKTIQQQQISKIKIGGERTTLKFDSSRVERTYTNIIAYDWLKDYTDFLTGKVKGAGEIKTENSATLNSNFFFGSYVKVTPGDGPNITSDTPAEYYDYWKTDIWNVYATDDDESLQSFGQKVAADKKQFDPVMDSNVADSASLKNSILMNTGVYTNLNPSTDKRWTKVNYNQNGINNPLQSIGLNSPVIFTKTYGHSVFKLGVEHAAYESLSTNTLTTSLLWDINSKFDTTDPTIVSQRNRGEEPYPYVDITGSINYSKFIMPYWSYTKINNVEDRSAVLVNAMENLNLRTGDIIPNKNTVMRYFNSNYEKYLRDLTQGAQSRTLRTDADDPSKTFQTGYITASNPALGTDQQRFSDGFFNRLSVKFVGRVDERNNVKGTWYNRKESTRGLNDDGTAKGDLASNRMNITQFAQDVHDSGYIEFINQPERTEPDLRSRFIMEPAGGYDYQVWYSGATAKTAISHALMWKHDVYDPNNPQAGGYLGKATPFKILPQMVFEYTSSTDSTGWIDPGKLTQYQIEQGSISINPIPTMELGGWYSGDRNPGYDNAKWENSQRDPYHPMYLYEFKTVYSKDFISSGTVVTPTIKGQFTDSIITVDNSFIPTGFKRDLGNKDNTWNEIWGRSEVLTFDTKDWSNSLLAVQNYRQLTLANITRDSTPVGADANIVSQFWMNSSGQGKYNYTSTDIGYNLDKYSLMSKASYSPIDGIVYNNFFTKMGWDYEVPALNDNGQPWDRLIRFGILPKMVKGVTKGAGYYKETLSYNYPSMSLGGFAEDLTDPYYFHSVHQWHVKTGTIGILGERVNSSSSSTNCGTDARAVTLLDPVAFNGGAYNICANAVPVANPTPGSAPVMVKYSSAGYMASANFAHPLLIEAVYDSNIMNSNGIYNAIWSSMGGLMHSTNYSVASYARELYDSVVVDLDNRNKANGILLTTDPTTGTQVWSTNADFGRTKTKGMYNTNFIQGELVSYKFSTNTTGAYLNNYLPIWVSGDLLPGTRLDGKNVKLVDSVVSWNTNAGTVYEPDYYLESGSTKLNSSLGAPGNEWESLWVNNIIADNLIFRGENGGVFSQNVVFNNTVTFNDILTSDDILTINGTNGINISTTNKEITIERTSNGSEIKFNSNGIDINTDGRILINSHFMFANEWTSTSYFGGVNASTNIVSFECEKEVGPTMEMSAILVEGVQTKGKYNKFKTDLAEEWQIDLINWLTNPGVTSLVSSKINNEIVMNSYNLYNSQQHVSSHRTVALREGQLVFSPEYCDSSSGLENTITLSINESGLNATSQEYWRVNKTTAQLRSLTVEDFGTNSDLAIINKGYVDSYHKSYPAKTYNELQNDITLDCLNYSVFVFGATNTSLSIDEPVRWNVSNLPIGKSIIIGCHVGYDMGAGTIGTLILKGKSAGSGINADIIASSYTNHATNLTELVILEHPGGPGPRNWGSFRVTRIDEDTILVAQDYF